MKKNYFALILFAFFILISNECIFSQNADSLSAAVVSDSSAVDSVVNKVPEAPLKIGDVADGNKSIPIHLIKLYDENRFTIEKNENHPLPFSTKQTCGDCHTYSKIKNGTHFSIDQKDSTKRNGEPFIYTNHRALTLLPLSYRGWKGTINPDSVGITPFLFVKKFGSHFTGGNISENEELEKPENFLRWEISGKLEVNCLVCHDANSAYDQADFAAQIRNENFKWASTSASNLANVKGSAAKMPNNFDPYNTNTYVDLDLRSTSPPTVFYDETKFDHDNKVFFDITKNINKERCLFCHTTTLNNDEEKYLAEQEDVHITAGMSCVNCHSNGMSHDIIKGYSEEYLDKNKSQLHSFSCEGCHLTSIDNSIVGRNGAPKPLHKGIPPIHFEKLSCTVCHSSYMPSDKAKMVKTSRAHKLGVPGANKMALTYPLIQSPVFVRAENGKIEPRNLIWPSYWAVKNNNEIKALEIEFVENNIQPKLELDTTYNFGNGPQVADSTLIKVFNSFNHSDLLSGNLVFITGGRIYELEDSTKIKSSEYEAAEPYTWAIAHNVRPAQQSLGVNGCDDCHSLNSNFNFSEVAIISGVDDKSNSTISMVNFEGLDSIYQSLFSLSFYFRPFLKFILIFSAFVITAVFLSFSFSGIKNVSKYFSNVSSLNNDKEI
ncbi:MAG: hypothetical protein H6613_18080 [Ignavibacteriales bacterium]|nr:hypothetical protein [Ignavibacteriales bacterium]